MLYAKAVAVLESGLRQFHITMATSSCELEQGSLHTGEDNTKICERERCETMKAYLVVERFVRG